MTQGEINMSPEKGTIPKRDYVEWYILHIYICIDIYLWEARLFQIPSNLQCEQLESKLNFKTTGSAGPELLEGSDSSVRFFPQIEPCKTPPFWGDFHGGTLFCIIKHHQAGPGCFSVVKRLGSWGTSKSRSWWPVCQFPVAVTVVRWRMWII